MQLCLELSDSTHQYIYGQPIEVTTDQKPLETILKKPLSAALPRLQRMMLRLQRYDLNVRHKPRKEIPVADTFSRLHLQDTDNTHGSFDAQVHMVMANLSILDTNILEPQSKTRDDPALQQLIRIVQAGWPNHRGQCPKSVLPYWNYRDELTVIDGLVFKRESIVIPTAAKGEMLKRIHVGHMGIVKCKNRAKEVMVWPNMNGQIEEMISNGPTCLQFRISNAPKEPMISREVPEFPCQVVAADLYQIDDEHYLIVVEDYHSRYFELEKMSSTTCPALISRIKAIFARFRITEKVVSDNGPQFAGA